MPPAVETAARRRPHSAFAIHGEVVQAETSWFIRQARAPRLRTMRDFAESEVVIPDGPFEGRRFRCDRQPFNKLWFDEVDSGRWRRLWATGPSQSSKTLTCFIVPQLYHLFEVGETVICGLPDMDMASDKWREDIFPVIERSKYRELLPRRGGGSRGGTVEAVRFMNGVTLKFMSGGGRDKSRAGFTSRVLAITEADGLDESGEGSHEADKITQLQARLRAWGNRSREYGECTVTVAEGRTWREITKGSNSRLALRCQKCQEWVIPTGDKKERQLLVGWQEAETAMEARESAAFACPHCGGRWTEDERIASNQNAVLLHRGQSIDAAGLVIGERPKTDTLGFRWSAINNAFVNAGDVGADEWRAARAGDEDNAEKEMCQFVWAIPHETPLMDTTPLDAAALTRRVSITPRGVVPTTCEHLTVMIDTGKRVCHYVVLSSRADATSHVVDYGRFDVASDDLGVEKALLAALRDFRELIAAGWATTAGEMRIPDQVWIDSGWSEHTHVVYEFVHESNGLMGGGGQRFFPTKGYGASQTRDRAYRAPAKKTTTIKLLGEGYHIARIRHTNRPGVFLVEINADHWKSFVHERLASPQDAVGAMTFYQAMPMEHTSFTRHITAERRVEEFVAGKGVVARWQRLRRSNHWLDCLVGAAAAAHFCGARLIEDVQTRKPTPQRSAQPLLTTPDGRPFLITERH